MTGEIVPTSNRFGLYLHIPICAAKCPYCDFVSYPLAQLSTGILERIVAALGRELELAIAMYPELQGRPLDSIYFGGGTPSLIAPDDVAGLIRAAKYAFAPREPLEVTLECNPIASELDRLGAYREAGGNAHQSRGTEFLRFHSQIPGASSFRSRGEGGGGSDRVVEFCLLGLRSDLCRPRIDNRTMA